MSGWAASPTVTHRCGRSPSAVELSFDGIVGEAHAGTVRLSCTRVTAPHPRGTPIRNVRQLTVVAEEDLREIARAIGLTDLDPSWLGAQVVLRGLPDLTHVPSSSRLQAPAGTAIVVDMANRPCHLPSREIEQARPGPGKAFKAAAGRRGVTTWVEREGPLALGERLALHVRDQPVWGHFEDARAP